MGAAGHLVSQGHGAARDASLPAWGAWLIGVLALAYALSDVGVMPLPRPVLREAVPITWWRWWRPSDTAELRTSRSP